MHAAPPASVAVPGGSGSVVVRRVVASDNSCLFNAVGYVVERSRDKASHLRRVIAETVAGDPEEYSEAFLGKPNKEYCAWIKDPQKWGGAIELSILSRYFGREIAAYDVQTKRCDVYGQDAGYEERVMLIYDGLHYDALAVAAFEGAPEDVDITMFDTHGSEADSIGRAAAELVAKSHEARQFTDTANFTLRCGVCQLGVKGEKEALEHAKATGHQNFGEY
ncbi:OTU-domain-containing protein [Coccomyxa subellipsoidea C-169]|uniref:Ubiquitin thioesterase OTU n=1 Tax=Coccomyxa subellipsoidea (strain C-169) TaxID=574566 RepID=I0YIJ5_COCSC|nr:OTU-domain-containing protein [Coccomyxa subellipsoidea C-169]EIE18214.1 OTU-domain-containing protein [Coccomyxa subellipsoidea C-169]|eukprot:XP_005642758.1 OTU-domain-containing protein [Coccomyxa subellipsoidea C-169]